MSTGTNDDRHRRLVLSTWDRVDRYATHGDHADVLDPAALADAHALLDCAPGAGDGRIVLNALAGYVLAWLWWYRIVARFPTPDTRDLERAREYLDGVRAAQPGLVPDGIARYLSGELAAPPPRERPNRAWVMDRIGDELLARYLDLGDPADLDAAVAAGSGAVTAARPGDPELFTYLHQLSIALRTRFTDRRADPSTGPGAGLADIDDAVSRARHALASAPEPHEHRAALWSNLGRCLFARYSRTGDPHDLHDEIEAFRRSLEATPPGTPAPVYRQYLLWKALRQRHEQHRALPDLRDAVTAGRHVIAGIHDPALRRRHLADLCDDLHDLARWTHTAADIAAALSAADEVVGAHPDGDPLRAMALSRRGLALRVRYRRDGRLADLDDAVRDHRAAVACAAPGDADLGTYLDRLATALSDRFDRTGDLADVSEAIDHRRQMIEDGPSPDTANANNLAIALYARYEHTRAVADLDDAVTTVREALGRSRGHGSSHTSLLICLAAFERARFSLTRDVEHLRRALAHAREAVAATTAGTPERAANLSALSNSLVLLSGPEADATLAAEAVRVAREATRCLPPDNPDHASTLLSLGHALMVHAELTGDPADLPEAARVLRTAMDLRSAKPITRMRAGSSWAGMERLTGSPGSAADAFTAVNALLPVLAWRGLDRVVREENLVRHAAVAREAAAAAITAGRLELAVELLERGRALLWGQTLHTRSDLTALHAAAPHLAGRMEQVRAQLADLDHRPHRPGGDTGTADRETAGRHHRRLAEEWEHLLDQARSVDGFVDLLAPAPFARLRDAARGGPVIMINVAPPRCDALIVTTDGVRVVPLPDLTAAEAEHMATAFLRPTHTTTRAPRDLGPHDDLPEPTTRPVLSWLWDTVARPVLDTLGHGAPPADLRAWPRVWWCPTGPLSALPLHAAGRYPPAATDAAPDTVHDRVISSYTPTLDALLRARTQPRNPGTGHGRLLCVGMATTPGTPDRPMLPSLPAVPLELARVAAHWPATTLLSPPLATAGTAPATRQALLGALADHSCVHLACHGVQDTAQPAASAVHVADGMITALELAGLALPGAELAFLSACATATGTSRLPDEAIHLSAAFQVAGFRQVVATLWPVRDDLAPELADAFYAYLTRHGSPRPSDAPLALHHAVAQLRRHHPDPWLWAPYIHVGP